MESDKVWNKLDKRGEISIPFIILIFVACTVIMGFIDITNRTTSINEIQGIMDTSGVIALRDSVDEAKWESEETLVVDKSKAKNEYINLVNEKVGEYVGEDKLLKDFRLTGVRVYKGEDTVSGNIQGKEQYYLEASAIATYTTYSYTDKAVYHGMKFFDFLNTGDYETISVNGEEEDGESEVIVRTVSRLALR